MTALDPARASLAGGLIYMFQIAGGAIGLGITTTIFTLSSEDELAEKASAAGAQLTDHQTAVLHGVLAGTDSGDRGPAPARPLGPGARSRRSSASRSPPGSRPGFRFVAIAAVLGFLISLFFVGGRLASGRAHESRGRAARSDSA